MPQDLLDLYMRQEKAMSDTTLRFLLEPLAGSSFLTIAIDGLQKHFAKQRLASQPPQVFPLDVYLLFFKPINDTNIDSNLVGEARDAAEIALWSHCTENISVGLIYPDSRLQPGEMALHQMRHDLVYTDESLTEVAYTHSIAQWTFFKDGLFLTTIPTQRIYCKDTMHYPPMLTILADGAYGMSFFHDFRQSGVAAISPLLQTYKNNSRMLFVSDNFDFNQAVRST